MPAALDDVTVVSFAQLGQGPIATQMLGDMGAEVIKIERPDVGEWMRHWSMANTFADGESLAFLSVNRNKLSVEADLKDEDHLEAVYGLIEEADVVIENFRPGVMDRLGLGWDDLKERNRGLVYCSSSGYGAEGPYADRPGQDLIIQGISGLAALTGREDDPPTPLGTTVVDFFSAAYLAFAILTALHYRNRTGVGQKIEGDLFSATIAMLAQEVAVYTNTGIEPDRSEAGIAHAYNQAPYGIYETADGYLTLSLSMPAEVGEVLDISTLDGIDTWEAAYERRDEVKREIEAVLRTESTDHWLETLWDADIWCGPVNDLPTALEHPHVDINDLVETVEHPTVGTVSLSGIPVRLSETPGRVTRHPPLLGEHTEEVFDRVGFSP
ncbi:MAG: CoA transferase [Halobacteriales archaeon]|nr:CoA transferase [Halobacteriales archaeon]